MEAFDWTSTWAGAGLQKQLMCRCLETPSWFGESVSTITETEALPQS